MNFSEKLKELRKSKNMNQEQLAEKLYVSRQAITKWENGTGLPDIANLVAISNIFNESLDSLLSEEKSLMTKHQFLYESRTEYDLDEEKTIDIHFGIAHELIVEKTSSEKIEVLLASNKITSLGEKLKVKIDENKKRMDVDVKRTSELSDSTVKDELFIFLKIPQKFVALLELNGITENLKIRDIDFDNLEFAGKFLNGFVSNSKGHIELDTNSDLTVDISDFKGKIDFNQIKATSIITVKNGNAYLRRIGKSNSFVNENNQIIELSKSKKDEDLDSEEFKKYDFIVELAGYKSELKVIK
ncbi:MAG: helix-turn-helix domain-containing protein [Treponema sp.]|nr:helix-turn-helix domain-containing protein [Treponema sp.]